ncbi:MAG: cytidylate kinase-like family protein, partial [Eubacterium sp.]|nr:cytidylate kinase-like family protein [Eubacterium sp.]
NQKLLKGAVIIMAVDLKVKKIILTIGREFGSGGRKIGSLISAKLGIPFYDKDLLNRAAEDSGIDAETFDKMDEKRCTSLLFSFVRRLEKSGSRPEHDDTGILSMNERLYLIQKQIIKNIAKEGSCIIMGRCSNITLKKDPDAVHIFIKANHDFKVKNINELKKLEKNAAEKLIKETDKERAAYFKYYTGGLKWGQSENYNYIIDSSVLGLEGTADLICDLALRKLNIHN